VADQENNPNSLLNKFRTLAELKQNEPALAAYAEFVPVYAKSHKYPFVYARANDSEVILCFFNPSNRNETAVFELEKKIKHQKLILGENLIFDAKGRRYSVEMPPVSYALYKVKF